jgi:hypothetical protein
MASHGKETSAAPRNAVPRAKRPASTGQSGRKRSRFILAKIFTSICIYYVQHLAAPPGVIGLLHEHAFTWEAASSTSSKKHEEAQIFWKRNVNFYC